MKHGFKLFLWVLSILLAIIAAVFFTTGFLPGVLMLLSAIMINPMLLERLFRMKGVFAGLLIVGLMIASFSALSKPNVKTESVDALSDNRIQNRSIESVASPIYTPINERSGKTAESTFIGSAFAFSPYKRNDPTLTNEYSKTPSVKTVRPVTTPSSASRSSADENVRGVEIEILFYTETVGRGEYASIEIKGEPNTNYTCDVQYITQMSTAKGLGEKQSDGEGHVAWEWKVGTNTSLDYRPTIYIKGGEDTVSIRFDVTE